MAPPKRKSPPPSSNSSPSHSKRQRLSPGASTPHHLASALTAADSPIDSLSSLSPAQSRASSPEEEEEDDDADDRPTTAANAKTKGRDEDEDEDEEEEEEEDDDDDDDDDDDEDEDEDDDNDEDFVDLDDLTKETPKIVDAEDEEEDPAQVVPHPITSAKSVPSSQPRPSTVGGSSTNKLNRSNVGGKGKKGEEALEHAVAAREEVERRRVELKGPNVENPALKELDDEIREGEAGLKVKEEEEEGEGKEEAGKKGDQDEDEDGDEPPPPPKRERPALAEERANVIQFRAVTNDSKPDSMIILTGLKNVFQKQLPKMPREYIARLVFDRAHWSLAIVKRGLEVVGGITYRPFEGQKFAEIVFCAITGTEQVKGYGLHMMNHLKDHVKATTSCMHFLTYADNYAIGYFKKQGFTKEIHLDRSIWAGYIKDYEGGTIMHCAMLPRVKYLTVREMLAQQKEVILGKIRAKSQSHVVHAGLQFWKTAPVGTSIDPTQVSGLKESGWTPEMEELTRRPKRGPQFAVMKKLLTLLIDHPSSWAFASPVNAAEVTDYYDVIKEPMDLATMENKLEANSYSKLSEFLYDAKLIFDNCRQYNDNGSNYVKNANKLEHYLQEQVKVYQDP